MSSASICIGESASYTVSGCINYTYMNTPATSPSFTNTSGVVSPTTHTSYQVTGMNQFGCISSTLQVLFVNPLPTISIIATPTMVCAGFPSTLMASGAPSNTVHLYSWAHGGAFSKTVVNPTVASTYTVTGTNTITSCQNSKTVSVKVFQSTFSVIPDTATCNGVSITLTASGATSYSWTGGPTSSYTPFYIVSPTVPTTYSVSVTTVTLSLKCSQTKTIAVDLYPQPTITASASHTLISRCEWLKLWGNGTDTYYWLNLNQTGDTVWVVQPKMTTYTVVGMNSFGCRDTAYKTIYQSGCPPGFSEHIQNQIRISVFPTPSDRTFTLDSPGQLKLHLHNVAGQLVKEIFINSPGINTVVTEDLPPGAYFITGSYQNRFITEKIIIQR